MSTSTPDENRPSDPDDTQPDVVQQQPEAPDEAARQQGDDAASEQA